MMLEPEVEGFPPSKSWAEEMEERERVWTAAAQRIIAERLGKMPTACSQDVEVLITNNHDTEQNKVDRNQAAPSSGRGYAVREMVRSPPLGTVPIVEGGRNNRGKYVPPVPKFVGNNRGKYCLSQNL
ncbi:hypothetical protein DPMN_050716 [Dreissena polymorpha]|uniref:Uncharacterized protein n=1 Tax=Dreissena polymorpha TaxID=45954 RepID=A0A9D4CHS1_DREPO|nr:hypothetical protein DPMN_050716 [Dreissena polymorpha]